MGAAQFKVQVVRPCLIEGKHTAPGTVLSVSFEEANELIAVHAARAVNERVYSAECARRTHRPDFMEEIIVTHQENTHGRF